VRVPAARCHFFPFLGEQFVSPERRQTISLLSSTILVELSAKNENEDREERTYLRQRRKENAAMDKVDGFKMASPAIFH